MWFTVLITPLISSNLSCRSLYCLSCDLQFWLPLWYLQTFLVGHCIACHVIYRSDYPFDIFQLFLLVSVLPVMWFTVLITTLISSNFSCWSLYCLSCDLPFWLPLWYLQTFLVGHCISCHVIYRSVYPFDIFKLFLLVIEFLVMWFTVLITPLISSNFSCWSLYCPVMWFTVLITPLISSNFSCWSLYFLSCDITFWWRLWYLQTFLVGHCISCHVIYRSDYPFDIFKLFLLVIVLPVMWFTVLITTLISSNFSCWSLYCLSCDLPFWLPLDIFKLFLLVIVFPVIWFMFWLPLWYLQTFLVGHCIACHVSYRSDYPFDIFKLFLLVIVFPVMWFTVLITPLISFACQLFLLVIVLPVMWFTVLITPLISSNLSCRSLYCPSCDLQFWLPLWYLQTFLVGHCIACHVIYRSDYPFDIFKLFLLVIVFPVMWYTVLITPLISSNFPCWSLYCCHVIYSSDYPFDIFKPFL